MGHSKYPVPQPDCPYCGTAVPYSERKKCRECQRWCHRDTCSVGADGEYGTARCVKCAGTRARVEELTEKVVEELELQDRRETAAFLVAALEVGADIGLVMKASGLTEEEVRKRADRLAGSGVWVDGQLCLPKEYWSHDGRAVVFILLVLCADGEVVARRSPPVEEKPG